MKVMDFILTHEETQSAYSTHLLLSHQGELRGRKEKKKHNLSQHGSAWRQTRRRNKRLNHL